MGLTIHFNPMFVFVLKQEQQ